MSEILIKLQNLLPKSNSAKVMKFDIALVQISPMKIIAAFLQK